MRPIIVKLINSAAHTITIAGQIVIERDHIDPDEMGHIMTATRVLGEIIAQFRQDVSQKV